MDPSIYFPDGSAPIFYHSSDSDFQAVLHILSKCAECNTRRVIPKDGTEPTEYVLAKNVDGYVNRLLAGLVGKACVEGLDFLPWSQYAKCRCKEVLIKWSERLIGDKEVVAFAKRRLVPPSEDAYTRTLFGTTSYALAVSDFDLISKLLDHGLLHKKAFTELVNKSWSAINGAPYSLQRKIVLWFATDSASINDALFNERFSGLVVHKAHLLMPKDLQLWTSPVLCTKKLVWFDAFIMPIKELEVRLGYAKSRRRPRININGRVIAVHPRIYWLFRGWYYGIQQLLPESAPKNGFDRAQLLDYVRDGAPIDSFELELLVAADERYVPDCGAYTKKVDVSSETVLVAHSPSSA